LASRSYLIWGHSAADALHHGFEVSIGTAGQWRYSIPRHEHEADRFALEMTHNSRARALSFVKAQRENLLVPRPAFLDNLWRGTHPPLGERIEFANSYHPWTKGEAGK
jgi:hypothetical protein